MKNIFRDASYVAVTATGIMSPGLLRSLGPQAMWHLTRFILRTDGLFMIKLLRLLRALSP